VKRRKEGGIWVHAFLRERRGRAGRGPSHRRHDTRKEGTISYDERMKGGRRIE
jgi:hypothetical protein